MEFEKKYGTRFWMMMEEIRDELEVPAEYDKFNDILESMMQREIEEADAENLLMWNSKVKSPKKEQAFDKLAAEACHVARTCALDIKVKSNDMIGWITLKSDMVIPVSPIARKTLAKLMRMADGAYMDAVDGEVRIVFSYNLFDMIFEER